MIIPNSLAVAANTVCINFMGITIIKTLFFTWHQDFQATTGFFWKIYTLRNMLKNYLSCSLSIDNRPSQDGVEHRHTFYDLSTGKETIRSTTVHDTECIQFKTIINSLYDTQQTLVVRMSGWAMNLYVQFGRLLIYHKLCDLCDHNGLHYYQ